MSALFRIAARQYSPLHVACIQGNKEKVFSLVYDGAAINVKDSFGYTPFQAAYLHDDKTIANFLASQGADVNNKNIFGHTSLHINCLHERLHEIEYLLSVGASIDVQDDDGMTPIDYARKLSRSDIIALFNRYTQPVERVGR